MTYKIAAILTTFSDHQHHSTFSNGNFRQLCSRRQDSNWHGVCCLFPMR